MLTFNEEHHQYRYNEKVVPSVTKVIKDLSDFSGIQAHVLKTKSELGTEFHRIIALHFLDDLIYDTIDSRLIPAFDTFLEWSTPRLEEFRGAISEHKMFDKEMWLAGTCDLATETELFDWKLRNYIPETDILQLEGYDTLLAGPKRKRWTICFNMKSGKLTQKRSEHDQSHAMFMYMLDYYHSKNKDITTYNNTLEAWKLEFK
ncbi:MAG: hypothetical protein GY928_25925 [Colwellia sp.]|nr:hypothetical protein [Colwellia sp.]